MSDKNPTPELGAAELNALFEEAREAAPVPSADLLARIAADAAAEQAAFAAPAPASRRPWWRVIFSEIGGLPAMGGLAASACAGVYLGFANPDLGGVLWDPTLETDLSAAGDALLSDPLLGDFIALTEADG